MFIFKHGSRRAIQSVTPRTLLIQHRHASKISIPFTPPPVPVIETCPSPTCPCREMPPNLDIERESNISGSMASYAEQILISTGRSDWKSKIEDEEDAVLVRQLKSFLTRGGKYQDPFHNIMITNSSFPPSPSQPPELDKSINFSSTTTIPSGTLAKPAKDASSQASASAYLLPSFTYIPHLPLSPTSIETFLQAYLLPTTLHPQHPPSQQPHLLRQPQLQAQFPTVRPVEEILILICSHGGRDTRCGILGPVLKEEFTEKLKRQGIYVLEDADLQHEGRTSEEGALPSARVGLISHIGGHKWAGNVIVYIPPSFTRSALAGKGIWYGRVGPEHVEGIVAKTIVEGKVIKELFRGGLGQEGKVLRM